MSRNSYLLSRILITPVQIFLDLVPKQEDLSRNDQNFKDMLRFFNRLRFLSNNAQLQSEISQPAKNYWTRCKNNSSGQAIYFLDKVQKLLDSYFQNTRYAYNFRTEAKKFWNCCRPRIANKKYNL
ncbi:Hypothetical_protein [Hexamita inflata]|uniref:Hypothetical_protein n=1 Tax=Hexamita inflata TaxID=28002 RepID=A0AA86PHI6_9EUKA|nr:Hypothetical protein HINF_LOCUS27199 [Hexamita inflata]